MLALVLAKSADPPGEAGGMAGSEFARPQRPPLLIGNRRCVDTAQLWVCACTWEVSSSRVSTYMGVLPPVP